MAAAVVADKFTTLINAALDDDNDDEAVAGVSGTVSLNRYKKSAGELLYERAARRSKYLWLVVVFPIEFNTAFRSASLYTRDCARAPACHG